MLCILLLFVLVQGVFADEPCAFVKPWRVYVGGSSTTPYAVAIDTSGNVYVTETDSNRVAQYSPEGSLNVYWDLRNAESGKPAVPSGIAVDAARNVYITERENNTIQKLTPRGREVWGSEGTGNGQFSHPTGIAVDSSGNVYVADTGNNRIQKIHSTGTYLLQWGLSGTSDGALNAPAGITIDTSGQVYVTDTGNSRIQKFTSDGTFLTKWGSSGTGNGQFLTPSGIAVDSWGNVYVADLTSRVQKFSPTGEYFSTCNTSGSTYDIAIAPSGSMYVLWQSGPVWKIGEFSIPPAVPMQTPVRRQTFTVMTPGTSGIPATPEASVTLQNRTIPVPPATDLTTAPDASPATGLAPALTPVAEYNAGMDAPGNQSAGNVLTTGIQKGVFDRISGFLRDIFGVRNVFSSSAVTE